MEVMPFYENNSCAELTIKNPKLYKTINQEHNSEKLRKQKIKLQVTEHNKDTKNKEQIKTRGLHKLK